MKIRKNRMVSILLAMVLVLGFAGCGNTIPAVNEKDSEKMTEGVTEMVEDDADLEESIADEGEPVEQSTKVDKLAGQTAESIETIAPAETGESVQTDALAASKKPAATEKPYVDYYYCDCGATK